MNLSLDDFKALHWQSNSFRVVEKSESQICLKVDDLSVLGQPPASLLLSFQVPTSEWAMLWDDRTKSWLDHPDSETPIGSAIVEAWIKPSRIGLLLSLAGNHAAGWSRWGFTTQGIFAMPAAGQ
jgi:hypothetical protein